MLLSDGPQGLGVVCHRISFKEEDPVPRRVCGTRSTGEGRKELGTHRAEIFETCNYLFWSLFKNNTAHE